MKFDKNIKTRISGRELLLRYQMKGKFIMHISLTLITLLVTSVVYGQQGCALGPDENLCIYEGATIQFTIPSGKSATLVFTAEASYENAIEIYSYNVFGAMVEMTERGNYSRPLGTMDVSEGRYAVACFSKFTSPNGSVPWKQIMQVKSFQLSETSMLIGCEDGVDHDFNDVSVQIQLK